LQGTYSYLARQMSIRTFKLLCYTYLTTRSKSLRAGSPYCKQRVFQATSPISVLSKSCSHPRMKTASLTLSSTSY